MSCRPTRPGRFLSAICVLLLFASPVRAQEGPLDGFSSWVEDGIDLWKTPGLAVAVVKDDAVVFEQAYGVRDVDAGGAVDTHTLFANASTTKAFTAMAVAMLVDDGKLGWMDRVVDHVPEFRVKSVERTMEIRVADLLSHRTGVAPTNPWVWQVPKDEGVRRLRFAPTNAPVRSTFEYNNDMFVVAGVLIERVSGLSWPEFLKTRILYPLGMTETRAFAGDLESIPNMALSHFLQDGRLVRTPYDIGVDQVLTAGSMLSNVDDMTKWLRFLLDGGKVNGEALVSADSFAELFRLHVPQRETEYPAATQAQSNLFGYGLGWFLQDYRGRSMAMHTGSIDGMVAIVGLLPSERLGVVVFANRDHVELRHAIMYEVFDRFLGPTGKDWSRDLYDLYSGRERRAEAERDSTDALRVTDAAPSAPLEAYAGTYRSDLYGDVILTWDGTGLRATGQFTTRYDGAVTPWNYDVFRWTPDVKSFDPWEVPFELDSMRKIVSLQMSRMGEFVRVE